MSQQDGTILRRIDDSRLERIEKKIDILSDAMISLARAEEKLISIEKNNQSVMNRLDRQDIKIENIEKTVGDNNHTIVIVNRVFWLLMASIISVIAFKFM
jgi:hypothetical protein